MKMTQWLRWKLPPFLSPSDSLSRHRGSNIRFGSLNPCIVQLPSSTLMAVDTTHAHTIHGSTSPSDL